MAPLCRLCDYPRPDLLGSAMQPDTDSLVIAVDR
jgi:hypothetical protein